ncbi:L-aspartate oxidase [Pseudokineococcus sp. 1T1Z-3]|uniref:L-aspartate oxidase n=1 Tax=Pseudokineococcus sp. 1T1Z-3 TaxID=3132745 RepID=UPI0030B49C00
MTAADHATTDPATTDPATASGAPVLVVGTGVAGMTTALGLRARGVADVVLVTKTAWDGASGGGSTAWAQGGVAAVTGADDDVALHVADTLAAGAGACDEDAVRVLCTEGPVRVVELAERGLRLDGAEAAAPVDPALWRRGLEAAHSRPRVLHAGGDATGAAMSAALVTAVGAAGIAVRDRTALAGLVVEDGRVVGAELLGDGEGVQPVAARAVVLATGGAGQLSSCSTNPPEVTGDGLAAAWLAGAVVADLEQLQLHPTVAATAAPFLVSEAVRGEGAVLRDEEGRRFLADPASPLHDPRGELAPRDVVARAVAAVVARQEGRPVLLDATALGAALPQRFPSIHRMLAAAGVDWTREPVPVRPAAHYWMGGVATDVRGRTSLPGLWAVGEVARTGVHGANRLASNSLLEGLVFGDRAAADVAGVLAGGEAAPAPAPGLVEELTFSGVPDVPRAQVQQLVDEHAGLLRDAHGLELAAKALDGSPLAAGPPATHAELEDRSLAVCARLLVASAARRPESLGAHFRSDAAGCTPRGADHPVVLRRAS